MRLFSLLAGACILIPTLVFGQDSDDSDDEVSYSWRNAQSALDSTAASINQDADTVNAGRQEYMQRYQIYENVISLRTKDALMKKVDEMRQAAGAADGGSRIGVYNPYDGSSYVRYYDKDGNAIVSEARKDYDLLQQQNQYWEKESSRVRERQDALTRDFDKYTKESQRATAAREAREARERAAAEVRRAQQEAERAEQERQQQQQQQQQPRDYVRPSNVLP